MSTDVRPFGGALSALTGVRTVTGRSGQLVDRQLGGDVACPLLDAAPVAVVARTSADRSVEHPSPPGDLVPLHDAAEHAVVARVEAHRKTGLHLLGFLP